MNSLQDLTINIIPQFLNYPLLSQKAADFILFKEIVTIMKNKGHFTDEGIQQLINIRASLNLGLSDFHKSNFPDYKPVPRPLINPTEIPDPNWITGFTSAEGCFLFFLFFVNIFKTNQIKIGQGVQLIFKLTQHTRDKELLKLIAKYFKCGTIYSQGENAFDFQVYKFPYIFNIIIPMFKLHPILGIQHLEFKDFCKVASLIEKGEHLTEEGLAKIILTKNNMNTKRK